MRRHRCTRGLVCLHIATTEAIDGLLGITDHHQPATRRARGIAIDRIEDAELDGIRVLELIDQRDRPCLMQRIGQRTLSIARLQRIAHAVQQGIEGGLIGRIQTRLQYRPAPALGGDEEAAQRWIAASKVDDQDRQRPHDLLGLPDQRLHIEVLAAVLLDPRECRTISKIVEIRQQLVKCPVR